MLCVKRMLAILEVMCYTIEVMCEAIARAEMRDELLKELSLRK